MPHPEDTNYILLQQADGFSLPDEYGRQNSEDQELKYLLVDNRDEKTAGDLGYIPGTDYDAYVLVLFPDAPNGTYSEADALQKSEGDSGEAWNNVSVAL